MPCLTSSLREQQRILICLHLIYTYWQENFYLSGVELQEAIQETFSHRGITFDDIVAFEDEFTEDFVRQNRWESFIKKKKAIQGVSFKETTVDSKDVLMPIVGAIQFDSKYNKNF